MELSTLFAWFSARHPEVFDGIAMDIGANIGNHALYFSDYFRWVHCFEPNPRTFKVLALNAELASNITCFNVGISDSDRVAHMSTPSSNVTSGTRRFPSQRTPHPAPSFSGRVTR